MHPTLRYGLFVVSVLALASTAENYVVRLAITIAMYFALTMSWNFIDGFAGTSAFFGD